MSIKHIDHLNLSVRNFEETAQWYGRVFGFAVVERGIYRDRPWGVLKSGEAMLCVYEDPKRAFWAGAQLRAKQIHGVNHFALRITDRQKWEETIIREGLKIENGAAWEWPHSTAWYLDDPTGYNIEVALWNDDQVKFLPT